MAFARLPRYGDDQLFEIVSLPASELAVVLIRAAVSHKLWPLLGMQEQQEPLACFRRHAETDTKKMLESGSGVRQARHTSPARLSQTVLLVNSIATRLLNRNEELKLVADVRTKCGQDRQPAPDETGPTLKITFNLPAEETRVGAA